MTSWMSELQELKGQLPPSPPPPRLGAPRLPPQAEFLEFPAASIILLWPGARTPAQPQFPI